MGSCIATSIEQSKKLIELGIDVSTADMRYGYIAPYDFSDRMYDGGYDEVPYPKDFFKKNHNFSENEYDGELPAWSLSALLDILPKKYYPIKDHDTDLTLGKPEDKWCILYWDATGMQDGKQILEDNLVDAAFEMVVWLLENNKL